MSRTARSVVLAFSVGISVGCDRDADRGRRASAQATAEAEENAAEVTLTAATVESKDALADQALRAQDEVVAAFRLEQMDYRTQLETALDTLDHRIARTRLVARERHPSDLKARRALLKADLTALDRATEQDWATLRTRLERDLAAR